MSTTETPTVSESGVALPVTVAWSLLDVEAVISCGGENGQTLQQKLVGGYTNIEAHRDSLGQRLSCYYCIARVKARRHACATNVNIAQGRV